MTTAHQMEDEMTYTWFSVITPQVFKEYKLPSRCDFWSDAQIARYEILERLADLHRTYIRASTYRLG